MEASAEVQSGHVEGFSACCPWRDKGTGWVGQSKDSTRRKNLGFKAFCGESWRSERGNVLAASSPCSEDKKQE